MRIIQINNCHYRRGGADVVYLDTGRLLEDNGHEVAYFSSFSENTLENEFSRYFVKTEDILKSGIKDKLLSVPKRLYSFETKRNLSELISDFKPQLAHIHLYKGELTVSLLLTLKQFNVPTVITLHDYSLLCPRNILFDADNNICDKCISGSTFNCILKRCNRKNLFYSIVNFIEFNINNKLINPVNYFNKIICVSKFNYNIHLSSKEQLKTHLTHLYNFSPVIDKSVPNHSKGNSYLYFGRLSKEKGVKTLIHTFERNGYNLKIVGTGELFEEIQNYINTKKLTNIEMLGFKSGSELTKLICDSSFVIVPSEWFENNPMTIIEAYALGKPVIGSRIGGIPEIIIEGETGFTFEMGNSDELLKVTNYTEIMTQDQYGVMSNKARAFAVNHFSESVHYNKLISIYDEILKN